MKKMIAIAAGVVVTVGIALAIMAMVPGLLDQIANWALRSLGIN